MLLTKMLALIAALNVLVAGRAELIENLAIALLTRKNLFVLGGIGQAKSYLISLFFKCITGAKVFTRLLTKQTDEEALFGRIDLNSYIAGNPRMITTGKIPDADFAFLDEIWKSNEGILNSLLTATNERRYTNEGETIDIPVISFMSASNEIPNFKDPEQEILRPLYDRFEIKIVTQDIESSQERLRILRLKKSKTGEQVTENITLEELLAMQGEVAAVTVPDRIDELMDDILCELRRRGIHVSDRKFLNYYPMAQAKAWLSGRNTIEPADLTALKCYLWTKPEEISTIQQVLERFCVNPVQERLKEIDQMAAESNADFKANAGTKRITALRKLRGELVRLHQMLIQVEADAHDKNSKADVAKIVGNLEKMSRAAHEKYNLTYAPLPELAELEGERT